MKWEYSEVMAYLEYKIINDEATDELMDMYHYGQRYGKLAKVFINKLNKLINKEF